MFPSIKVTFGSAVAGRITLKDIRGLAEGRDVWDGETKGFGARRQRSASVAYILMYRTNEGRQRRYTIGRHGAPWTPDTARDEAKRILGLVASGQDPAEHKQTVRKASTVAELCDVYLADVESGRLLTRRRVVKKESTVAIDKTRIERHIKPLLGRRKVKEVTRDDVESFMHDVATGATAKLARGVKRARTTGGRGTASRTMGLLGAIFEYAVRQRIMEHNLARGVIRYADNKRERRLSDDEYARFGAGLRACEGSIWPAALAGARFLALTGWRRGEMLDLKWPAVDISRRTAVLADTKTGRSIRPLSKAACSILAGQPRNGSFVFPAMRGDAKMTSFQNIFVGVVAGAGLSPDITPHVLRHSFASVAADLGYSDATIGALIGHKGQTMTSRYVHSADAVLLAAADAVASRIVQLLGG